MLQVLAFLTNPFALPTSLTDKNLTNPDKSKICYRFVIVFVTPSITNLRFVRKGNTFGGVSDVGNAKDLSGFCYSFAFFYEHKG